jgi:hypothetical protein
MKQQNLEQLVNQKLAEKDFAYPEGAWEEAAAQFDAWDARRRRRRLWLLWIVPLLLAAGTGLWGLESFQRFPVAQPAAFSQALSAPVGREASAPVSTEASAPFEAPQPAAEEVGSEAKPLLQAQPALQAQAEYSNTRAGYSRSEVTQSLATLAAGKETAVQTSAQVFGPLSTQAFSPNPPLPPSPQASLRPRPLFALFPPSSDQVLPTARVSGALRPSKVAGKGWSADLRLGLATYRGYASESTPEPALGSSPLLGIGMKRHLSRRLSLRIGLSYQYRNQLNHSLSRTDLTYGFVEEETQVSWQPERLHWLALPLELGLKAYGRHRLLLGARAQYLLGSEGSLNQLQRTPFGETEIAPKASPSYVTGLSTWDVQGLLGYEMALSARWRLGLRYHRGLRDLLQNERFASSGMNRSSQLSFHLSYQLR